MKVGTFLGIPLLVNPLFLLLLIICSAVGLLYETLVLFAVVLWHETAHVLVAKRHRLDVMEIELLPFGGVAKIEALLQMNPSLEVSVAIAGPLSNLVLIGIVFVLSQYYPLPEHWLLFIYRVNVVMVLFNCLPALPLDGGRVLRSFFVRHMGFQVATEKAAKWGQYQACLLGAFGGYGIYLGYTGSIVFIFMSIFLFSSARKEQANASYIFMRYLTRKKQEVRLQRVFAARQLVATAESALAEVFRQFSPPAYHVVYVLDLDGNIAGIIGELELINGLFAKGMHTKVGDLLQYRL